LKYYVSWLDVEPYKMASIMKALILIGTAPIWAPLFFGAMAIIVGITTFCLVLHAIFVSPIIYLVKRRFPISLDQVILFYGELLTKKKRII
jgi:hypothetical protein